jgi:hypothetical protein
MANVAVGAALAGIGYVGSQWNHAPGVPGAQSIHGKDIYADDARKRRDEFERSRKEYKERTAPTSGFSQIDKKAWFDGAKLGPAALQSKVALNRDGGPGEAYQGMLAKQLYDQTTGKGPSVAELQMNQGLNKSLAQQLAAAGSAKGVSNTSAMHKALLAAGGAAQQQTAADAATLRAQEIMAARQQLGGLSTSMAGQQFGYNNADASLALAMNQGNQGALNQFGLAQAGFNQDAMKSNAAMYGQQAQMNQAVNLANMQSQLQTMGLNDQQIRALLALQQQESQFGEEMSYKYDMYNAGSADRRAQMAYGAAMDAYNRQQQVYGAMMNYGGQIATMGAMSGTGSEAAKGTDSSGKTPPPTK